MSGRSWGGAELGRGRDDRVEMGRGGDDRAEMGRGGDDGHSPEADLRTN